MAVRFPLAQVMRCWCWTVGNDPECVRVEYDAISGYGEGRMAVLPYQFCEPRPGRSGGRSGIHRVPHFTRRIIHALNQFSIHRIKHDFSDSIGH